MFENCIYIKIQIGQNMFEFEESDNKVGLGYVFNKDIFINFIVGIDIKKFCIIENQMIVLGDIMMIFFGWNGMMKMFMMGLIVYLFLSDVEDVFGNLFKMMLSEVFKFLFLFDID